MKEALLYSTGREKRARCHLCWNLCNVEEGERGRCNARLNVSGRLYTLTYGNISAMESRPVEIKPFFHFMPGTTSMTFSTYSCNLSCMWCQNWRLSRTPPPEGYQVVDPEKIVRAAIDAKDRSTCASFNEPTLLFEYLLDLFPLAKEFGLRNTMVSNGYMMPKALKMLINAGLDAINIDVKGSREVYRRYCGGKSDIHVWKNIRFAAKRIHVEVVNLLVRNVNDDEDSIREIVEKHLKYAGDEIPIHFTRYFPAFLFDKPPTDVSKLERAVEIARREGVEYAYIGNVPGHKFENTYCPQCGVLLVQRYHTTVLENRVKNGKCPNCGKDIYGIWS
ncbi:AmmeMemoRadiSam system radical SAM enzyme [Archaeoglobus veneficus]|uniref:Radical SAM domain protein n=1 Tax=Archaeoglobus veneficus (strain DSM 11195 / SNP6) TaxID=693661 RepID=F2KNJ0_ARCVS|nr:AmmeMemoRadiSam system radical SAM enzyme [Archaeoglobus veneficus]AEA46218.1 Radical SAM domain protein [Archaeoglobus veneficus SNP6]